MPFRHALIRRRLWLFALCASFLTLQHFADAQPVALERVVYTDWGQINDVRSAWEDDAVGVHHSAPFVNSLIRRFTPSGGFDYVPECSVANDGYTTSPSDPGRKLHHAIVLGAFLHGKEVRFTLKGCSYDRPRIIAVEVR